ncbi:hypothetical protein HGH92_04090 [Chitinophaga varians]|uniref:Uncharacterized protein n=1 Tax=Chitinophaga varians TaxID=2202339 RepID=A0A847R8R3_9BACT|nr:hypothetical protein [Chitinophaga varians]NLR63479.1 hypothetical protein [Chitinophaga varians]
MKKIMMKAGNPCLKSSCVHWTVSVLVLFTLSCSRQQEQLQPENKTTTAEDGRQAQTEATCCWVAITNQATKKIEVYDPADASWTTAKWSWMPTTALSYNATSEIPLWEAPTDIKVRNNAIFDNTAQVITATSYRLATIARYTGTGTRGQKLWVMGFNDTTSLHAMEILPDGNCVVASAGKEWPQGWIRIYSSSQPVPNHGVNTQYYFPAAHAVLWDNTHQVLWALGNQLRKYGYNTPNSGGSTTNPKLELLVTYNVLPSAWGHDLSADVNNPDQLLLSTNGGVYIFHVSNGTFSSMPGAAQQTFVKAISSQPGQNTLVETRPSSGCTINSWCTSVVNFYNASNGNATGSRTVSGSAIYKAKTFDPNYY